MTTYPVTKVVLNIPQNDYDVLESMSRSMDEPLSEVILAAIRIRVDQLRKYGLS